MDTPEALVERKIVKWAIERGYMSAKLAATGSVGFPDRLFLFPGGRAAFLEVKRPGKKPSTIQRFYLKTLADLGFAAGWTDNYEKGIEFLAREAER